MSYTPVETILTLDQLKAICQEWQALLRLQDWDVDIKLVAHNEVHAGAVASSSIDQGNQTIVIKIVSAHHVGNDNLYPYDMELTLVHEVVHAYLDCWPVRDKTLGNEMRERACERLAEALVALKRRMPPPGLDGQCEIGVADPLAAYRGAPV